MTADAGKRILEKMLERLYAGLANGPLMNCRPHASRQRIDLRELGRLEGPDPSQLLPLLLGTERSAKYVFRKDGSDGSQAIWNKLRAIADDARTYEQDTGVQALYVGFPLMQLPPDARNHEGRFGTKRILAPVGFVPVQLSVKGTRPPSLSLETAGDGADLVVPNAALLAWVQQVSGKKIGSLDADEEGKEPWRELNELVAAVCAALELPGLSAPVESASLIPTPRAEDERGKQAGIVASAVLGLFPAANQGLLSDLEALVEGEAVQEPLRSFLRVGSELGLEGGLNGAAPHAQAVGAAGAVGAVASEHCVSDADPCQVRAVRLARRATGLVIHGPPGTGKSQTITNIVADHLSKGDRVLFVCDKRTALDVVHYRLQALGLGNLCAVVHDAQRDQRELYRAVREQLEALPEAQTNARAQAELEAADRELRALHDELSRHAEAVSKRPNGGTGASFHELVGQWFSLSVPDELSGSGVREIAGVGLEQLSLAEREVREVLSRGKASSYPSNPWTSALGSAAAGTTLESFLKRPTAEVRETLQEAAARAQRVDELASSPELGLDVSADFSGQAEALRALAAALEEVQRRGATASAELARFAAMESGARDQAGASLAVVQPLGLKLAAEPLDRELLPVVTEPPKLPDLVLWAGRLASFLEIARKWYGFLFFGRRGAVRGVLERFGLTLSAATAERLTTFLERLRVRVELQNWLTSLHPQVGARLLPDAELARAVGDYEAVFRVLGLVFRDGRLRGLQAALGRWLSNVGWHAQLLSVLPRLSERALAVDALRHALARTRLFAPEKQSSLVQAACAGQPVHPEVFAFAQRQDSLEHLLRIRERLSALPQPLSVALSRLLDLGAEVQPGWEAVQKGVLAGVIGARLASEPALLSTDGERLRASYQHYRELEERRRTLGLQVVLHRSIERQRERLLASTGSRLNTLGADVRRRLVSRGERAMRLRQVIQQGASIEGGDPLFDLRPVWMASPEVVAQLMPRTAVFDVVIFDEASQCRLEEALPVLTRAKRVVIAGDPKQLPPTRFFESAVTESQESETEGDQELFEAQQSETEDLLTAALNLSIEQAYLDVHYRSSNADLIGFSNTHFYDARLQPIPAHPKNFAALPPLKLIHAQGTYDKRANVLEARRVVAVVKELLSQPEPPSIGIACFNLTQRDCINEALADAAEDDPEFGARLATARNRTGKASFEGLFVKNLENVQGDERDHLIISTTYGPDPAGKFYRRFGPLAQAGGGRRLNVLVTRARQQVHIVTSIPPAEYRATQAVPDGKQPNGALLLYAYLSYAERLERTYADELARRATAATERSPECRVRETTSPSELAVALGQDLKERYGIGSEVHWGNEGFGVDAALAHPLKLDDVTVGVICDGTRFAKAPDPVQWDVFRLQVLKAQGWELSRVWSPQLFRDPEGSLRAIQAHVEKVLEKESKASAVEPVAPEATALN